MSKRSKIKFNIIIVTVIILLTVSNVSKTLQEDTFYMIKVGEYIYQNGLGVIINRVEPFSWLQDLTYTYPHWLLDLIVYQIYNTFSFDGIYVFTILAGIIIYLLIYYTNIKVRKKLSSFCNHNNC